MSKRRFQPGQIVWAVVCDRNNQNPKERPLLVIPPAPLNADAIVCCLAISTNPENKPDDPTADVPWDANTGSTTGLYAFSRAVLLWHVALQQVQVTQITGRLNMDELNAILQQREIAKTFAPPRGS